MFKAIKKLVREITPLHSFAVNRSFYKKLRAKVKRDGCYTTKTFHIDHDQKLIYMSNSKVACSSIKASLYHLEEQADYREVHKATKRQNHYEMNVPYDKYDDYFKFTFVRNPFARLVSCYVNKLHEDKEKLGVSMKRLYFENYLFGYLNKDKGFSNWAARVCRIPDKLADRHFVGQYFLTHDKAGNALVNHIYNFENLSSEYEKLRETYSLAPLPHYNKTKKGNWMDYYDMKTANKVYNRYKKDIVEYGYQETYDKLIAYIKEKS